MSAFDADWETLVRALHPDAPRPVMDQLLYVSRHTGLDPLTRQLYLIQRKGRWQIQSSIDGFRVVAGRSPRYMGQAGPFWCGPDEVWKDVWVSPKPPTAAKVGVRMEGDSEPTWGVARFDAYSAGGPMWAKMGDTMIAKCAEALALRKCFPAELSGIYTADEMAQAGPGVGEPPTSLGQPEPSGRVVPDQAQPARNPALDELSRQLQDLTPLEAPEWLDALRSLFREYPNEALALYNQAKERGVVT